MPVNLNAPLTWSSAAGDDLAMLNSLQANILKGHVRDSLAIRFLTFSNKANLKQFLIGMADHTKSAKTHLEEARQFKIDETPGSVYVGVGLTKAGYDLLGIPTARQPNDPAFVAGAKNRTALLNDPASSAWEVALRGDVHAVVLVGDATQAPVTAKLSQIKPLLNLAATKRNQPGKAIKNLAGDGLEHFGYVDGRSQPLFLTEDIAEETAGVPTGWSPSFPLNLVITQDRGGGSKDFGSYFVYRKLAQNVRRFKQAEADLAAQLGLTGTDAERAGAMVVGRFEDGTPLVKSATDGLGPKDNSFTYGADLQGSKCPFHSHIRKTNPRGTGGFEPEAQERRHLMARRGQTYGNRNLAELQDASLPPSARPTSGVGLLFMAFNTDIANQFEFTQRTWANNPGFPAAASPPGLDDVIAQGTRGVQQYPTTWGGAGRAPGDPFAQAVTLKGAEYFFFPSLTFLRSPV